MEESAMNKTIPTEFLRQFNQGGNPQRTIEVQMQVGLRDAAKELRGYGLIHCALFHRGEQITAATLRSTAGNIKQNRREWSLSSSAASRSATTRKDASNR